MGNDLEGNKKIFFKEVKRVTKGEQAREEKVKDVNGLILGDDVPPGGSKWIISIGYYVDN